MELNALSTTSSIGTGAAASPDVPQATAPTRDEQHQPSRPERRGTDLVARIQHWWQNDGDLDVLERHLQLCLAATNDPAARRLLHAYTSLKPQPSGELFNFLLAFRTARPGDPLSDYERLGLERSLPFTSCIDELRATLRQTHPPRLQIWHAKLIQISLPELQLTLSNLQCFDQCHTRRYSNWRPVFRVKDFCLDPTTAFDTGGTAICDSKYYGT
jgi:hypothetical protein